MPRHKYKKKLKYIPFDDSTSKNIGVIIEQKAHEQTVTSTDVSAKVEFDDYVIIDGNISSYDKNYNEDEDDFVMVTGNT